MSLRDKLDPIKVMAIIFLIIFTLTIGWIAVDEYRYMKEYGTANQIENLYSV